MTKNDTFIKLVLNRVFNDYVYYDNINVISNKIFNILNKDIINKYTKLLNNKLAYYVYFNDLSYLDNTLKRNLYELLDTKYDKLILNYNKNNDNDKLIKKYNTQTKLKKLYNDHISNSLFNLLKNYKNRSYNYNNIFKLEFNLSKYFITNEIDIYIYINTLYLDNNSHIIHNHLNNDIKHDREIIGHYNFKHIKIISHEFNNYLTAILLNELFIKDNNISLDDKLIKYFKLYYTNYSYHLYHPSVILNNIKNDIYLIY
tara:strand:+ start:359 stop:1132 length:774 start_codon:yes stop_codon:yes gene_type:complete